MNTNEDRSPYRAELLREAPNDVEAKHAVSGQAYARAPTIQEQIAALEVARVFDPSCPCPECRECEVIYMRRKIALLVRALEEARAVLSENRYSYSDDDEWNNDDVIDCCTNLDAVLAAVKP